MPRDGQVVLREYDPNWEKAFAYEAKRIADALKRKDFVVHHVGSTSIAGICAKPILDLLLEAPSLTDIDSKQAELESLGYEYKGEYGIAGRRYCVLYDAKKSMGFVHVHAFAQGSAEASNHILFRDFLRAHPERAKAYQELKVALVSFPSTTRAAYTDAKAPLILEILEDARRWKRET
jgi:GrpB-like predicted nucleotidyltransferase (UPF0157 family)